MSIVLPKFFWPLTITSANRAVHFNEQTAGDLNVNIDTGTYNSAEDLRANVQTKMRAAHANVSGLVVGVNSTGHFTFSNATRITMRWTTTTNTAAAILGYDNSDYTYSGGITGTAPYQHQNGWYPGVPPNKDSLPIRDRKMDVVTLTVAGQTKFLSEAETTNRALTFSRLPSYKSYIAFESTNLNEAAERLWQDGRAKFRYWPDGLTEGTYYDYCLDIDTLRKFTLQREFTRSGYYVIELGLLAYVA